MNKNKQDKQPLFSVTEKDFVITTMRAGGKGGQHQNTTDSAVRIVHKETGISAESRSERSQIHNKKLAFKYLVSKPDFQKWLSKKSAEVAGIIPTEKEINIIVDEWIKPENLKVETYDPK